MHRWTLYISGQSQVMCVLIAQTDLFGFTPKRLMILENRDTPVTSVVATGCFFNALFTSLEENQHEK